MAKPELVAQIARRLAAFEGRCAPECVEQLASYVDLAARWNRKMNLTSLPLDPVSDAALDRLVVEPVIAARHVRASDQVALDVGSGGGSPAIPFFIAARLDRLVMVEARERKSAFLREAVRSLGLSALVRTEYFPGRGDREPSNQELFDIITVRAVELDSKLWRGLSAISHKGTRLYWFHGVPKASLTVDEDGWIAQSQLELTGPGSLLTIFERASVQ